MTAVEIKPVATRRVWKLSPSDFSFLWEECKRCFYLKVVQGFRRPATPFPSMFSKIAGIEHRYFDGRPTKDVIPDLPAGTFVHGERRVISQVIEVPDADSACYIAGRIDTTIAFDDESYAVVDFKTAEAKLAFHSNYGRQLHAYAHALQNPGPGGLALWPVMRLGLLCLDPADLCEANGHYWLRCQPSWIEIPFDTVGFERFLAEVLKVLDLPEPPEASPSCTFCQHHAEATIRGL